MRSIDLIPTRWWYIGLSVRSERLLRLTSTMTPSKVISDMGHPLDSVNAGSLRTIQFDVAKKEQKQNWDQQKLVMG